MTTPLQNNPSLMGQALVDKGFLSPDQLQHLLAAQPKNNKRIGEAAVSLGFIDESALAQFLSVFFNIPFYDLVSADEEIEPKAVELISEKMARRYGVLVIKKLDNVVTVVMADPLDVRAIDAVRLETHCRVKKMVGSRTEIIRAIDRFYHTSSHLAKSMDTLLAVEKSEKEILQSLEESTENLVDQLKLEASDAPVVQFVNLLLMRAVQERASDIHVEPEEHGLNIRLRVDGDLREMSAPPKRMYQAISTRIKLLSTLDIAERRLPQDGRFKFQVFDKQIDVRVSCLPTLYGEKIVMRILDRSNLILDMKQLGFEAEMLDIFKKVLTLPHGLVFLTGPTGSGKTTTLYAALNNVKSPRKNVVTVEDPVEYQLAKINQVHTRADIGLSFAAGLRSILRQDPDIIMVGEIRDRETAEICIRAALTGHLVLSTLHTNDSTSAISRLIDMGIEPYLLAATVNLVMAQRLVRRICEDCSEPWDPPKELLDRLSKIVKGSLSKWNFQRGKGCSSCAHSGYRGRIAIYEQFVVNEAIRGIIAENAPMRNIFQKARKNGLQTLLESALNKVRDGITTLDEAFSVCATQGDILD